MNINTFLKNKLTVHDLHRSHFCSSTAAAAAAAAKVFKKGQDHKNYDIHVFFLKFDVNKRRVFWGLINLH